MITSIFSIKKHNPLEILISPFSTEEDATAIIDLKSLVENSKYEFTLKLADNVSKSALVMETQNIAVFYFCEGTKPMFCWFEKKRIQTRPMLEFDEKIGGFRNISRPPPPLALGTDWALEKSTAGIVATALYFPVTTDDPGLLAEEFDRRFQPGEYFAKKKQKKIEKSDGDDSTDRTHRLRIDFGPDLVPSGGRP